MTGAEAPRGAAGRVGAVYDRGYRPYQGALGGRRAAAQAIFRASVRRSLGLGRSWRAKFLPFSLLALASLPAAVNVGIGFALRGLNRGGFEFFSYREYVGISSSLLLFVAVCAPDVVCPERRSRVLPLLFARPLTGRDYLIAKLGAVAGLVFVFSILPQVLLFVGRALVSDGALRYARDNAEVLWQVPLSTAAMSIYYGSLGLAIASLTTRRVVAGAAFLGLTLVSAMVAEILRESGGSGWTGLNLLALPLYVRDLIFLGELHHHSALYGVSGAAPAALAAYLGVLSASLALLWRRYRSVEA